MSLVGPRQAASVEDTYQRLLADLKAAGARYRLIEHASEAAPRWSVPCAVTMWPRR